MIDREKIQLGRPNIRWPLFTFRDIVNQFVNQSVVLFPEGYGNYEAFSFTYDVGAGAGYSERTDFCRFYFQRRWFWY